MLRHSWATHAEARGLGELMVQRQLRHTTKRTQKHYRHADEANIAAAVGGFTIRSGEAV
jgi:integrase